MSTSPQLGYVLTSSGQRVRRKLAACGTRAAYRRHLRRVEPTCRPCCDAEAAYRYELRAARRACADVSRETERAS